MDWRDILAIVGALQVVTAPAAYFLGRIFGERVGAAMLRLADATARRPVHRVTKVGVDPGKLDAPLLRRSYRLYKRLMSPTLCNAHRMVQDWLREDIYQVDTEEFWLVYRKLRQEVRGVLFGSWTEPSEEAKANGEAARCFVSGLVAEPEVGREEQLRIMEELWARLEDEVEKAEARQGLDPGSPSEYFVAMVCRDVVSGEERLETLDALHDFMRRKRMGVVDAVLTDVGEPKHPAEIRNMLVAYVGPKTEWSTTQFLRAIYDGFLVWSFEFPDDIPGAQDFAKWGNHVDKIRRDLLEELDDPLRVVPFPASDEAARSLVERCPHLTVADANAQA